MATTAIGSDRKSGSAFEKYYDAVFMRDDKKFYFGNDGDAYAQFVSATGALELNGQIWLSKNGGALPAQALLLGAGSNATPATTAVANKFFLEFRCETTATEGDNRLAYLRYAMSGANAAGGGECVRAFTALSAAVATARGAHFSLIPSGSGAVSGLGTALSSTLHFGTAAFITGTVAAVEANPYADGTGAPPTEHGAFRIAVGGNATGAAKFKNVLQIDNDANIIGDKAAVKMVCNADVTGGGCNGGIQVRIAGVQKWIPTYPI